MRSHLPGSSLASCVCALALTSVAAAQSEERAAESVVLLAPAEVRAEWTAALQLELAARGALAVPADVPQVATTLLGDAEAQRTAIARGARAAVWVEPRAGAWRLRMVSADAERARVVPVARDADARTVALIVVSLLDGAHELPALDAAAPDAPREAITRSAEERASEVAGRAPRPDAASPGARLDRPHAARPAEEPAAPRREPYVRWSGLLGVSVFAFASDVRADFGGTLRAGIAMRYGAFEAAVLHDLGLYLEQSAFGGVQPYGRACVESGGATPRTAVAFHAGARGCFGSAFALEVQGFEGGGAFISSGPRTHASGGGYVAVSFALSSWIRLFIRADVDVAWTDLFLVDSIDAVPTLSSFLSFD